MTVPVTRDELGALIRSHASKQAAAEILEAVDGYAWFKASVILVARDARDRAGICAEDDPYVTAQRRAVLAGATLARPVKKRKTKQRRGRAA